MLFLLFVAKLLRSADNLAGVHLTQRTRCRLGASPKRRQAPGQHGRGVLREILIRLGDVGRGGGMPWNKRMFLLPHCLFVYVCHAMSCYV